MSVIVLAVSAGIGISEVKSTIIFPSGDLYLKRNNDPGLSLFFFFLFLIADLFYEDSNTSQLVWWAVRGLWECWAWKRSGLMIEEASSLTFTNSFEEILILLAAIMRREVTSLQQASILILPVLAEMFPCYWWPLDDPRVHRCCLGCSEACARSIWQKKNNNNKTTTSEEHKGYAQFRSLTFSKVLRQQVFIWERWQ